jgi:hypothetical protein
MSDPSYQQQQLELQQQQSENTPDDLSTPKGYANLQASLEQGFLNVIARKNAAQKSFNAMNIMSSKSQKADREKTIKLALSNVYWKTNNLADFVLSSFTTAASTAAKSVVNIGKGGNKTRKARKSRKSRKSRR